MEDMNRVKLQQSVLRTQQLIEQLKQQRKMLKGELRDTSRSPVVRRISVLPQPVSETTQPVSESSQVGNTMTPETTHVVKYYHSQPAPAFQPIILNTQPEHKTRNTKSDVMEMMMIQNAQMHQAIMQQLMLSNINQHHQPPTQAHTPPRSQPEWKDLLLLRSDSRPPSVHHYYHNNQQANNLPPIQMVSAIPTVYTPVLTQVESLKQPKPVRLRKPNHTQLEPVRRRVVWSLPFPGPGPLRKFRHAAYAVYFAKTLQLRLEEPWRVPLKTPLNEEYLMEIRLKEAVAAIHHIYLMPEKKICKILKQTVSDSGHDLTAAITASRSRDHEQAFEDLAVFIENIVYEMTEIMPPGGVLGTQRKSTLYKIIQTGQHFPKGYFWQLDKDLVQIDYNRALVRVSEYDVLVLLVGLFIGRGLVTTLLLKPLDYHVTTPPLTTKASQNLKLLATIFISLVRRVYLPPANKTTQLPVPVELKSQLFDEVQMQPVYARLQKSFDYAEQVIRGWSKEYFTRLSKVR